MPGVAAWYGRDMPPLVVDRERFLGLVVAIGSSACTRAPADAPPAVVVAVEAPKPTPQPPATATALVDEPARPPEKETSSCDNDVGGPIDCAPIAKHERGGPTCEGLGGSCASLAKGDYGYRPRVAEAIAACWERLGKRACSIKERERCNLEGIKKACPEASFESRCEATLAKCRAAGARIRFTKEECVLVASSLKPRDRDWALGAMGPSAEGCRLMFNVY